MDMKFESLRKEVENCKKPCFGFELTEVESGEPYYENIRMDYDNGTMSAFGVTIDLDEEYDLDSHLNALYESIVSDGYYE